MLFLQPIVSAPRTARLKRLGGNEIKSPFAVQKTKYQQTRPLVNFKVPE